MDEIGRRVLLAGLVAFLQPSNSCVMDRGSRCSCDPVQYSISCTGLDQGIDDVLPLLFPPPTRMLTLRKNWVVESVSLRPSHLDGLRSLEWFDISKNRLSSVEAGTFRDLPQLRGVDLSGNRLRVLEVDSFGINLPKLERLNLASNRLVVLMNYNFQSLESLKQLDLTDNPLLYVSPTAFVGLDQLQVLRLSGCNLTRLPTDAFKSLVNLQILELRQFPFVTTLESGSFKSNSKLRTLIIDRFPGMTSLGVSPATFEGLTSSLRALRMTSCNLSDIPDLAIRNLRSLRRLDLSDNRIEVLGRSAFVNLRALTTLDLSKNLLAKINDLALRTNVNLTSLDISNNRLKTIPRNSFPPDLSGFVNLSLTGNRWSCDCGLQWILPSLGKALGNRTGFCATPFLAQGLSLTVFAASLLSNCSPPKIDLFLESNVTAMAGEEVVFPCTATGTPNPTITWYTPVGSFLKPLTTRVRHELPSNTLRIRFARLQDEGDYHCVASNKRGDNVRTVSLRVKGASSDMSDITPVPDTSRAQDDCGKTAQVSPLLMIVLIGVLTCVSCVGLLSSFFLALWGYNSRRETARLRAKQKSCHSSDSAAAAEAEDQLVESRRAKFAEKKVTFGQSLSSGYGSVLNSPNGHRRYPDSQRTPQRPLR